MATTKTQGQSNVRGFALWHNASYCGREETLYAVTEDGRIFVTGPHDADVYFDKSDRVWNRSYDAIPEKAEFIGNYPFPKRVRKWT